MSHIRDGFDRGFALARLAKQAKTQGDKRAAFTLLKQAIGVFMGLFPTIPDNRTQKMVAAECARMMSEAEALKAEIQAATPVPSAPTIDAAPPAPASRPSPSAPAATGHGAGPATSLGGFVLPTPPTGGLAPSPATGSGTPPAHPSPASSHASTTSHGGSRGLPVGSPGSRFSLPSAPGSDPPGADAEEVGGFRFPAAPTGTPRPELNLPSAPTHTPRRLVAAGGGDDAGGGGGAGVVTMVRPPSGGDSDAAPSLGLDDLLSHLPQAPTSSIGPAAGDGDSKDGSDSKDDNGGGAGGSSKEQEMPLGASASTGSHGSHGSHGSVDSVALAQLEEERAVRRQLELQMNRMSLEMKHLRIRHGEFGDADSEGKDATSPASRVHTPARSVTYASHAGKSQEVEPLPGVTCVLPACVDTTPSAFRGAQLVFDTEEHGSLYLHRRGDTASLLRVLPVHREDMDAFSARVHSAARLTHGFTDVPTIRKLRSVFFDATGALSRPPNTDTAVAVLDMPCFAEEAKSTIGEYIRKDTTAGAVAGAGAGAGAGTPGHTADAAASLLPCGKAPWDVQAVFLQLAQALALLHNGRLTGCLDRRTVTVDAAEGRVVVCAVEMPASSSSAPEAEAGGAVNEAADVYTLAAWMYEAHFGQPPVLMPGAERVKVAHLAYHDDGYSDRVQGFLANCLTRDPAQRLTAAEASIHPCLTKSLVADFQTSRVILETERKREALYECIQGLRKPEARLRVTVNRGLLVDTAVQQIMNAPREHLVRRFDVKFHGEPGIDAGGLTCELFQQFFEALFKDGCSLFACSTAAATKPLYLPNADLLVDGRLDEGVAYQYEGIGRMLVKSIFDGHPIPVAFAPSLYKFLLGLPVNMHDLEAFDRDTYDECVATLQTAPDELDMLGQDFEQVGEAPRDVTGDNRREFVSKLISYTLVKSRKPQLVAMKKGFDSLGIAAHLRLFTCTELMALVAGQQTVDAEEVVARMVFERFPAGSSTPNLFRRLVRSLNSVECRKLLVFATAQSALPAAGTNIVIRHSANPDLYPTAHTCFRRIDLPGLTDMAELERRLRFCLDNLEMSGFGEQ